MTNTTTGTATAICQQRANIYKKPRQVHPRHWKRLGENAVVPAGKTHACSCGNMGYADFELALGQRPPVRALGVIVSDDANDEDLRLLLQQR